jgi:hypothetical protein
MVLEKSQRWEGCNKKKSRISMRLFQANVLFKLGHSAGFEHDSVPINFSFTDRAALVDGNFLVTFGTIVMIAFF